MWPGMASWPHPAPGAPVPTQLALRGAEHTQNLPTFPHTSDLPTWGLASLTLDDWRVYLVHSVSLGS